MLTFINSISPWLRYALIVECLYIVLYATTSSGIRIMDPVVVQFLGSQALGVLFTCWLVERYSRTAFHKVLQLFAISSALIFILTRVFIWLVVPPTGSVIVTPIASFLMNFVLLAMLIGLTIIALYMGGMMVLSNMRETSSRPRAVWYALLLIVTTILNISPTLLKVVGDGGFVVPFISIVLGVTGMIAIMRLDARLKTLQSR